jgi:recombination protein RecA
MAAKAKTTKQPVGEKPDTNEGKTKALGLALESIEKQFGKGSIMKLGESHHTAVETTSTGALSLDIALGGGVPRGRVIEIYGPESSGKTTLTLHAIAEVQKNGGTAAFIDAEHALDPSYAKRIGVDTDNLLLSQPDNGEQALEIVETLVRSNAVDLIVIDSVAALVPRAEIEGEMGDSLPGLQARLMSQALRKLTGIISRSKSSVVFINQIRMKIGVMFGNPETTTGGNALKFYASVRMDIRRIGQIKQGDDIIGNRVRVKVVKNKIAPPFRQAEFDIMYNEGISYAGDTLDLAANENIVEKAGAWYAYEGQKIGQGREAAKNYLQENPKVLKEINEEELKELKTKSTDDKLYIQTLNYVSRYNKTKWEVSQYLKRKTESPALIELILNKLSILGLIDDFKFAKTYTSNRLRLRPTSRRKIQYELIKKHVEKVAIDQAMANIEVPESSSLNSLIEKKRLQTKYQDSTKLMQYLARQGFNYEDIKQAIKDISQ